MHQGKVIVNRKVAGDVDELKAILQGAYSYEQVMKMAEDLIAQMDEAMQQSTLPQNPDLERINQLCIELVEKQGW